jgi:hypothetical protein
VIFGMRDLKDAKKVMKSMDIELLEIIIFD